MAQPWNPPPSADHRDRRDRLRELVAGTADVLVVADRQPEAATALVDLMLATGGEMVTVLAGAQIADDTVAVIDEHLRRSYPGVELLVYPTGQQDDLIQVGVE